MNTTPTESIYEKWMKAEAETKRLKAELKFMYEQLAAANAATRRALESKP